MTVVAAILVIGWITFMVVLLLGQHAEIGHYRKAMLRFRRMWEEEFQRRVRAEEKLDQIQRLVREETLELPKKPTPG